jgi:hypothetical protein
MNASNANPIRRLTPRRLWEDATVAVEVLFAALCSSATDATPDGKGKDSAQRGQVTRRFSGGCDGKGTLLLQYGQVVFIKSLLAARWRWATVR